MQWTLKGARLLLQTDLDAVFRGWSPKFDTATISSLGF
jgi:hypothetical protein